MGKFIRSKATRIKMAQAHKGLKHTEETKAKISQARAEQQLLIDMGYIKPFRHSEATKKQLSRMAKQRAKARKKTKSN